MTLVDKDIKTIKGFKKVEGQEHDKERNGIYKKNQIKPYLTLKKNALNWTENRLDIEEEKISKLGDRVIENIQNKTKRGKRLKYEYTINVGQYQMI